MQQRMQTSILLGKWKLFMIHCALLNVILIGFSINAICQAVISEPLRALILFRPM